jgi:hypothetical protein
MNLDKKKQIMYQKTEFNNSLICQLPNIFKCNKCKRNNTINNQTIISNTKNNNFQHCLFCGNPNYIK